MKKSKDFSFTILTPEICSCEDCIFNNNLCPCLTSNPLVLSTHKNNLRVMGSCWDIAKDEDLFKSKIDIKKLTSVNREAKEVVVVL